MITKEQFDKLYDPDISKKEYDSIIKEIDYRFSEIMRKLLKSSFKGWYDYDNCDYNSEESHGYFDIGNYKTEIGFGGECTLPSPFDYSFPTRWLWEENFEEEFDKEIKDFKEKELKIKEKDKLKKITRKELKEKMKIQILGKLTDEEKKFVKFK